MTNDNIDSIIKENFSTRLLFIHTRTLLNSCPACRTNLGSYNKS